MRSQGYFVLVTLCLVFCVNGMAASKGSLRRTERTVTSTAYATFTVRPLVLVPDGPGIGERDVQSAGMALLAGRNEDASNDHLNAERVSQFSMQSVEQSSVDKLQREGVSVRQTPERKRLIVFINN